MDGLQGDFLSFYFWTGDGHYSSKELGLTRVSDGDRFQDKLIPEINDKTVEIPGVDGMYFYGSDFKQQTFSIKVAFDGITEEQLRKIRQVFAYKHTGEFIFEERPYKKYKVKVASPPELDYVCFDEQKKTVGNEQQGIRIIDREYVPQASIKEVVGDLTATVDSETFISQLTPGQEVGEYLFSYDEGWYYDENSVDLANYGITYSVFPIEEESEATVETHYGSLDAIGEGVFNDLPASFEWGEEMTFTFDGQDYTCTRRGSESFQYGAPYVDDHYDYTDYPFCISIDGNAFEINTPEEGIYTISVHYTEEGSVVPGDSITVEVAEVLAEPVTWEQVTPWVYNEEKQRIYKGEGAIEFVAYYPYATQTYKLLDEYGTAADLPVNNVNEWAESSGLMTTTDYISGHIDEYRNITEDSQTHGVIDVYNPGDLATGFRLFIPFNNNGEIPTFTLSYDETGESITMESLTRKNDNEIGIQINTVNGLVEGINEWSLMLDNTNEINDSIITSGNLYNEYVWGEFFKIHPEEIPQHLTVSVSLPENGNYIPQIYYDYLYL